MRDREDWLAETLIELADTGTAEFDEAEYARKFAERLAEPLVPDEVGMLIVGNGNDAARTGTGSSARAVALASLEARGIAGPCGDCCRSGEQVRARFGRPRGPEYTAAAAAYGFAAVLAFPMHHHERTIGAVCVLSADGRPPGTREAWLTSLLTEAATIGILHQRALQDSLRTSRQLQRAGQPGGDRAGEGGGSRVAARLHRGRVRTAARVLPQHRTQAGGGR